MNTRIASISAHEQDVRKATSNMLTLLAHDIAEGTGRERLLHIYCGTTDMPNPLLRAINRTLIEAMFHDISHGSEHDI